MRRCQALLLVLLLAVAGCSGVPTSGPVERVPDAAQPRGVEIAPEPPEEGVSAVRLVEGFLQAMADPASDYGVARQYLTSEAQRRWRPSEHGAQVYAGGVRDEGGRHMLVGTRTGTLDSVGRFTTAATPLSVDMGVVEENGEWRIGAPPEGVLISNYIFERYYAHVRIYFLNGRWVVPDLFHVPEALLTPSRVVEALLAGPGPDTAASVTTAIPPGVRLADEGASVDADGTVHVALTGLPSPMSDADRARLGAQLLWSLTAIPRVIGLTVTSNGRSLLLPDQNAEGILELATQNRYQPLSRSATTDLFAVRAGVAGRVGGESGFTEMQSSNVAVSEVAVSLDATTVAFIDVSRTLLLVGPLGGQQIPVSPGLKDLRSAQFLQNQLWVLGKDARGQSRLARIDGRGRVTSLDASRVTGAEVTDFSVSQTGARIALTTRASVGMATVTGGRDPKLATWRPLSLTRGGTRLDDFGAVEFSGETEVAVLASEEGTPSVFRAQLDGSLVEDLGPLGRTPVELAALPSVQGGTLAVRAADGSVLRYQAGTRWQVSSEKLDSISFPG